MTLVDPPTPPGLPRVPPLPVVEVGGRDEGEPELRERVRCSLDVGVPIVWQLGTSAA